MIYYNKKTHRYYTDRCGVQEISGIDYNILLKALRSFDLECRKEKRKFLLRQLSKCYSDTTGGLKFETKMDLETHLVKKGLIVKREQLQGDTKHKFPVVYSKSGKRLGIIINKHHFWFYIENVKNIPQKNVSSKRVLPDFAIIVFGDKEKGIPDYLHVFECKSRSQEGSSVMLLANVNYYNILYGRIARSIDPNLKFEGHYILNDWYSRQKRLEERGAYNDLFNYIKKNKWHTHFEGYDILKALKLQNRTYSEIL